MIADTCRPRQISETNSHIDWDAERHGECPNDLGSLCRMLMLLLNYPTRRRRFGGSPGSPPVADWIGSDERFFSPQRRTADEDVSFLARSALDAIGFQKTEILQNLSFHDLFHDSEKP